MKLSLIEIGLDPIAFINFTNKMFDINWLIGDDVTLVWKLKLRIFKNSPKHFNALIGF